MPSPRIVLVHGVATTGAVWSRVMEALSELDASLDVVAVERPCSGDLATEIEALSAVSAGALVVGASGGATLALALAASTVQLVGAIAHEPAVGSLVPGLLAPMAAAYAEGGASAFAATLYGASWSPSMAPDADATVARELPMFRAFEPSIAHACQCPVLVTVGADSPAPRHAAAAALHAQLGYPTRVLPGAKHFVQWDAPQLFAALIHEVSGSL